MVKLLARDAEGATKLIEVAVQGSLNDEEAKTLAKTFVNSLLIKTMCYGGDPNIGRIYMAIGKCIDLEFKQENLFVSLNGVTVINAGEVVDSLDKEALRKELEKDTVQFLIDLHLGNGTAKAYGCDLTEGYIKENAAYYSS